MKTGTPMSVEIIDSAYELLSLLRNNHTPLYLAVVAQECRKV